MAGTKAGAAKRKQMAKKSQKSQGIGGMPVGGHLAAIPPGSMVCSPIILKAVATGCLQIANAIHRELGLATATMTAAATATKGPKKRGLAAKKGSQMHPQQQNGPDLSYAE